MQLQQRTYIIEDLEQLEGDFELDAGKLVQVSRGTPEHGRLVVELTLEMGTFLRTHPLGRLYGADTGFVLERNPDTLRGPDLAFVRQERALTQSEKKWWEGAPDLAAEVLSPGNRPGEVQL